MQWTNLCASSVGVQLSDCANVAAHISVCMCIKYKYIIQYTQISTVIADVISAFLCGAFFSLKVPEQCAVAD